MPQRAILVWQPVTFTWPSELAHLPPPEPMIGAKRYHHGYLIRQEPEGGYSVSYKSHLPGTQVCRHVGDSFEDPFATLGEAKAACEADLRALLGRRLS